MKKNLYVLLAAVISIASVNSLASTQVEVLGRSYSNSCSYYTNRSTDLVIRYKNDELPWGTSVKLIYGWGGFEYEWTDNGSQKKQLSWNDIWTVEMPASEPFTWTTVINEKQLHTRGSPRFLDKFEFVVAVRLPDGSQLFEKGSYAPFGYYEVNLGLTASCLKVGAEKPAFQEVALKVIEK